MASEASGWYSSRSSPFSTAAAQIVFELESVADLLAQAGVEDGHTSAPARLGLQHRHVGVLEHLGRFASHIGQAHEADARRDGEGPPRAQLHRAREDRAQLLGAVQRGVGVGHARLERGEFVAVEAAQAHRPGHGRPQPLGHARRTSSPTA